MTTTTHKRGERRAPGQTRVTERDHAALAVIGVTQPIPTELVRMAIGSSAPVARRRLRVLRDHGLVKVVVRHVASENLYLLTEAGRERLIDRGLGHSDRLRVPRGLPAQLDHHLGSVRLLAALTGACAASQRVHLRDFRTERDIRASAGSATRDALFPDAAMVMALGHLTGAFVVESDTGSENPSVVARKVEAFVCARGQGAQVCGQSEWSVLILCQTERRLHRLVKAVHELRCPEGFVYFAHLAQVNEGTVLKVAPWRTVVADPDGEHARLVPQNPFAALALKLRARLEPGAGPVSADGSRQQQTRDLRGVAQ